MCEAVLPFCCVDCGRMANGGAAGTRHEMQRKKAFHIHQTPFQHTITFLQTHINTSAMLIKVKVKQYDHA